MVADVAGVAHAASEKNAPLDAVVERVTTVAAATVAVEPAPSCVRTVIAGEQLPASVVSAAVVKISFGVMVSVSVDDVLAANALSPPYVAVTVCAPIVNDEIGGVAAVLPVSGTGTPAFTPSTWNWTDPVGVPPAALPIAVNVTGCPATDGFVDDTTTVVVLIALTLNGLLSLAVSAPLAACSRYPVPALSIRQPAKLAVPAVAFSGFVVHVSAAPAVPVAVV